MTLTSPTFHDPNFVYSKYACRRALGVVLAQLHVGDLEVEDAPHDEAHLGHVGRRLECQRDRSRGAGTVYGSRLRSVRASGWSRPRRALRIEEVGLPRH